MLGVVCGFAGLLDPRAGRSEEELTAVATAMADTLMHRGPDDGGTWADVDAGLALGARRLAVIDLSSEGHQPMISASGRFALAYNGEIYNFESLRARLLAAGARFRGKSDTEVLLASIEEWGLEQALQQLNGMFAFALWDRAERRLQLARDRLGEKPLYFGWIGTAFAFGSELKALRSIPGFRAEVDRRSLGRYLRLSCVPAPYSIYEGVRQLRPGSVVSIGRDEYERRQPAEKQYWSAFEAATAGASNPRRERPELIADCLEDLLGEAVSMRLQADVPVGVFLSGGIDSSTVVALMKARGGGTVRSFTISFEDLAYDESVHAAAVARHIGAEHTEFQLTAKDARDVITKLPVIYDEPFADPSQIPTYLVSQLAREHVTVSLSGDGGDELFGGYNRHTWGGSILRATRRLPLPLRQAMARLLSAPSPASWEAMFARLGSLLPSRAQVRIPGLAVQKLARSLPAANTEELYYILASTWSDPAQVVRGLGDLRPEDREVEDLFTPEFGDVASQMMYLDLVGYLPNDILAKLDRASMAVSLEGRVPMLDHRVVELAWQIPAELKIKQGTGKWILREVLSRHVPRELVDRPKAGFGLPLGDWLRGPLRPWADGLLAPDRLEAEGYLEPAVVRKCWQRHLSGREDLEDQLWTVLMFQSWLETYPG